jgi:hypothetical protein
MKKKISFTKLSKSERENLNVLPKGQTISIGSNKLQPVNPNNNYTSLVVFSSTRQ